MWRDRLYAFLLRRILGPYLSVSSNAKLHQSIEISLNEGRFVLKDVDFEPKVLSALLSGGGDGGQLQLRVQKARVRKLVISLSLQTNNEVAQSSGSVAWKVLQLGKGTDSAVGGGGGVEHPQTSSTGSSRVSLVAHVEIDGVEIEFVPGCGGNGGDDGAVDDGTNNGSDGATTSEEQDEKPSGFLASYVDAALSSLRLSVQISDFLVRVFSGGGEDASEMEEQRVVNDPISWIGVRLATASYRDLVASKGSDEGNLDVVLHKSMEFAGFSIVSGTLACTSGQEEAFTDLSRPEVDDQVVGLDRRNSINNISRPSANDVMLQTEGTGMIAFRVLSYPRDYIRSSPSSLVAVGTDSETSSQDADGADRRAARDDRNTSGEERESASASAAAPRRLQHDVEVTLNQRFGASIDALTLSRIVKVIDSVSHRPSSSHAKKDGHGIDSAATTQDPTPPSLTTNEEDERDMQDLSGLMKQYAEARHLARTREVRGGILVPNIVDNTNDRYTTEGGGGVNNNDVVTFDTFFDANDQSFYHYRSMMSETHPNNNNTGREQGGDYDVDDGFVHTKIRFHLREGTVKLCFRDDDHAAAAAAAFGQHQRDCTSAATARQRSSSDGGGRNGRAAHDYMLITLGDVNVASSVSQAASDVSLTVSHLDVEDSVSRRPAMTSYASVLVAGRGGRNQNRTIEIGSLLRFVQHDGEHDAVNGSISIVSPAPCISVHASTKKQQQHSAGTTNGKTERDCVVEATFQPLELTYRESTLTNLKGMIQVATTMDDRDDVESMDRNADTTTRPNNLSNESTGTMSVRFEATCPSINVLIPLDDANSSSSDEAYNVLFDRCGYNIPAAELINSKAALGCTFDDISVQMTKGDRSSYRDDHGVTTTTAMGIVTPSSSVDGGEDTVSVKCHRFIVYARTPSDAGVVPAGMMKVVDLISCSGNVTNTPGIDLQSLVAIQLRQRRVRRAPIIDNKETTLQPTTTRRNNAFPVVPPLSSVKARQEYESDEVDDPLSSDMGGANNKNDLMRGADPQIAMSSNADECDTILEVHVPQIVLDMTTCEREALLNLVSNISGGGAAVDNRAGKDKEPGRATNTSEEVEGKAKGHGTNSDRRSGSDTEKDGTKTTTSAYQTKFGLALSCDQMSICAHEGDKKWNYHQDNNMGDNASDGKTRRSTGGLYSYVMIADGMKSHMLFDSEKGMRHIRLLSHDLTLFEVKNLCTWNHQDQRRNALPNMVTVADRCKAIRRRSCRNPSFTEQETKPLLHRSKLSCPLSPQTPALLLDVLMGATANNSGNYDYDDDDEDDDDDERTVHLSLYDMTYRYDVNSDWINRFVTIFVGSKTHDDDTGVMDSSSSVVAAGREQHGGVGGVNNAPRPGQNIECDEGTTSSVTGLFVSLADCAVDYTTPHNFKTSSRTSIRVGEVRLSSNLLVPAGPIQAYKLSVGDISVHLCNSRHPYNYENARLSCATSLMDPNDLYYGRGSNVTRGGYDPARRVVSSSSGGDMLQKMNFITVATLDSVDALLAIASSNDSAAVRPSQQQQQQQQQQQPQRPNVTANLTFGNLCLYTCRDSFACLTDTIGEWQVKMTALSPADIEALKKAESEARRREPHIEPTQVSSSSQPEKKKSLHSERVGEEAGVTRTDTRVSEAASHYGTKSSSVPAHKEGGKGEPHNSTNLLNMIENDMFSKQNGVNGNNEEESKDHIVNSVVQHHHATVSNDNVHNTNNNSQPQQPPQSRPYATIPDSELSATELRRKHGLIQKDDVTTDLAKTLLIKNYYTVDTTTTTTTRHHGGKKMDPNSFVQRSYEQNRAAVMQQDRTTQQRTTPTSNLTRTTARTAIPLGGYEWTTVDHEWSRNANIPPGEDQSSDWYRPSSGNDKTRTSSNGHHPPPDDQRHKIHVFPQHIPITTHPTTCTSSSDPLLSGSGDMNAAKLAGTTVPPKVKLRLIVKKLNVNCRFFDGYDWVTTQQHRMLMKKRHEHVKTRNKACAVVRCVKNDTKAKNNEVLSGGGQRRAALMGDLLSDDTTTTNNTPKPTNQKTFHQQPLPEERSHQIQTKLLHHKLCRQQNTYFQMSLIGIKLRIDSFVECPTEHRLASCLNLLMKDMYFAETVSNSGSNGGKPVKMFGEWLNDKEHPRDSNDGQVMMKMVTMHPTTKLSSDGKLMSDESRVTLELLPIRCFLHQKSIRFIRSFFSADETTTTTSEEDVEQRQHHALDEYEIPMPFFQIFKVEPVKLKVNYRPERMDVDALRDGSYVELINIYPLEDMVLTLKTVDIRNLTGWGSVFGELISRWLEDILATQLHKFITKATPFQPFTNVGEGVAELIVLPWDEYRKGTDGSVVHGLRSGTSAFAGTVAYEALNTTSKLTQFAAEKLNSAVLPRGGGGGGGVAASGGGMLAGSGGGNVRHGGVPRSMSAPILPSRPDHTPRRVSDAAGHALESLSRGLKTANYKVVIVPYREYRRTGPAGAAKSVVKGIPVAVMAPLSGATEALSYTLLGARNQLRPEVWLEEEATLKGLDGTDGC